MRTLDRHPLFDPKSRDHRAIDETGPLRSHHWMLTQVLNQGSDGACVGFSLTHNLLAYQYPLGVPPKRMALRIYRLAKKIDEWPGEKYSGTSVLAGCKVLRRKGAITSYKWAFGLDDVLQVLAHHGPLVLGINWHESMYEAPDGVLTVDGAVAGGHAILANGINVEEETVTLHNSWGDAWGNGGEADISWLDLDRLLSDDGEAVRLIMGPQRTGAALDE